MRLIFYNNWHNGDIHSTREFIKDIIKKTNFDQYYYLHNNSPKILQDIDGLIYGKPDQYCSDMNIHFQINDNIYVNVWIGIGYFLEDIGVPTIKSYYTLFSHIYYKLGIQLEKMEFYVPEINYDKYDISNINEFLSNNNRRRVLIDNVQGHSYQTGDFNFNVIIEKLANDFPNIDIIITNDKSNIKKDNIYYTSDIIRTSGGDLNEISYLSTFCDIIIGRSSGPYNLSVVKKNIHDINKTMICICNEYSHAFWHRSINSFSNKIWINNYNEEFIYNIIKKEMSKL